MIGVDRSIVVGAPAGTVYTYWERFDRYPEFVTGLVTVRPLGGDPGDPPDRAGWVLDTGDGTERTMTLEMTERRPPERIGWRATTEPLHECGVRLVWAAPVVPDRTLSQALDRCWHQSLRRLRERIEHRHAGDRGERA